MTGRVSSGQIMVLFKEWIVPHAKATAAMEYLNTLRDAKRSARWDTEATGALLLAPSHCGKSHIVNKMYTSEFIIPELRKAGEYALDVSDGAVKRLQKKFLYMKVPSKPNIGDFGTTFLRALNHPFPTRRENVLDRIQKAEDLFGELGGELIALDNFDQLTKKRDRKGEAEATELQEVIKNMLEHGIPIVFVGLYPARDVLLGNMQLKNRVRELNILPLRWDREAEELRAYIGGLELQMLANGIFDIPSGLCEEYVVVRLYYASQGRLGVLSNIIRDAAIIASAVKAPRINLSHLTEAVRDYALKNKICRYNPFLLNDSKIIEQNCKIRVAEDEQLYGDAYMEYYH